MKKLFVCIVAIVLLIGLSTTLSLGADAGAGGAGASAGSADVPDYVQDLVTEETSALKTLINFNFFWQRLQYTDKLETSIDKNKRMLNGTYTEEPKEAAGAAGAGAGGAAGAGGGTSTASTKPRKMFDNLAQKYDISIDKMQLDKWIVELNSSAKTIVNKVNSYCKEVYVLPEKVNAENPAEKYKAEYRQPKKPRKGQKRPYTIFEGNTPKYLYFYDAKTGQFDTKAYDEAMKYYEKRKGELDALVKSKKLQKVLGVRVHFPTHWFNAWARIKPPFEIAAYNDFGEIRNVGNGVINNVGQIRKIMVDVEGRNYNHSLSIRLKDQDENVTEYFLGFLYFKGMRRLIWRNPNYIEELDHREVFRLPLYPREIPYQKFDSFVCYRQGDHFGGNYVLYIYNVKVEYDYAIPLVDDLNVNDEDVWEILADRNYLRAENEARRAADIIDLRKQEEAKQKHLKKK